MLDLKEPLEEKEQARLLEKYKETGSMEARNTLIEHNLRLVVWVINRYFTGSMEEWEDMFQTGAIGLIRAMEDYNARLGSFGNYAISWIRQYIDRGIDNTGSIIRIPVHMVRRKNTIKVTKEKLSKKLDREPSTREIAQALGTPVERVEEALRLTKRPVSYHQPISFNDETMELGDTIEDESQAIDRTVDKLFMEEFKRELKDRLTYFQYQVTVLFHGLGVEACTMKEIAEMLGSSYDKVRTGKNNSLRIIRQLRFFQEERERLESERTYISSMDYTRVGSNGGLPGSMVESMAIKHIQEERELEKRIFKSEYSTG